jgi:hypothetical protein
VAKVKGRGSNPNSHGNNKGKKAVAKEVTMLPEQWAIAEKAGKGNFSKGLRKAIEAVGDVEDLSENSVSRFFESASQDKLFVQSPTFQKVMLFVELVAASDSSFALQAEALLDELDTLDISHTYDECFADGMIELPNKGAWIA